MTCSEVDRLLDPLVDGELAQGERAELEAHLAGCGGCGRAAASLRSLKAAVRRVAVHSAPPRLRDAVVAGLAAEAGAPVWPVWQRRRTLLAAAAGLAAAAAVAVLAARPGRAGAEPLVAAAVTQHARKVPRDIETQDPARAVRWVQDRVGFNPRVPALGLTLIGASVTSIEDRAAASFEFQDSPGRRISLIVFRDPSVDVTPNRTVRGQPVALANSRGYNVALWRESEMVYHLVADTDEQDVLRLLQQMGR